MNAFERAAEEHQAVVAASVVALAEPFAMVADTVVTSVLGGARILVCGNGGSAADAQHFASELVGRFEHDRRAVAAQVLHGDTSAVTAIANDSGYEHVFSRQVEAFGAPGDVLIAISTSGTSPNVVRAVEVGLERGLTVVALTGRHGGAIGPFAHLLLAVPADVVARIQEVHELLLHSLADAIESALVAEVPDA